MSDKHETFKRLEFREQMQNIGADVCRAIRFKGTEKSEARFQSAIEMMNIMCELYENRRKEFEFLIDEFDDYIHNGGKYDFSIGNYPYLIQKEFDSFL